MPGLYIHIPFCRSRCAYCDFFSTTRESEATAYVAALCRELEGRRAELPHARVRSIYIGGGTPSVLPVALLRQILDCAYANYDVAADAEVTMEMNPDDIGPSLDFTEASGLSAVNRVSLGIQTFDDVLLRLIRRRHDSVTAIRAIQALQAQGIRNISIDLIYGLPGQTLEQWESDLDTAFSLGIQHLSAYALSYEEGTLLTRWRDEGRVREASDELSVAMYNRLCQRAREAGFEHYEISNFALPGYRSCHNSSYWTGEPYLGFGPGAHSYDGDRTRRANLPNLDDYLHYWSHESHEPYWTYESLSSTDLHNEAVMCGLRTREGIDLNRFLARFGQSRLDALLAAAAPHLHSGRLIFHSHQSNPHSSFVTHHSSFSSLRLAESALMISDDVMSDLMA